MLVLTRKPQQSIQIGDNIKVSVVRVRGNTIQLGIEAPRDVRILRSELVENEAQPESSEGDEAKTTEQDNDELLPQPGSMKGTHIFAELVTAV